MTQDEFYQLNKGDTVRFKNYMTEGFNYYRVDLVSRISNELGIPMPIYRVWIVPLDESGNLEIPRFSREMVVGDSDIERMELVTV